MAYKEQGVSVPGMATPRESLIALMPEPETIKAKEQASVKLTVAGSTELTDTAFAIPAGSPRMSGIPEPAITKRPTMGDGGSTNAQAGPYPMPKWPVHHESAAFEAVAIKKALVLSPAEIYAECAHHGEEKSNFSLFKLLLLCTVAGCYVGFGYTLCLIVGGNTPKEWAETAPGLTSLIFGVFGFPFGFTCIVVCGAELYTSICAYTAAAWWEGKITSLTVLRMLVVSWCGNFAGCAIFVGLMYAAGTYDHRDLYTVRLAEKKVSYGWGQVFVKGIFANWLVGLATWMANAAQDLSGKAIAIWLPISAFAAIGFEHCIANMFLLPIAISHGANITASQFIWNNLIPATLGNWVGGAVCVATVYAFVFGTPGKQINERIDRAFQKKVV